MKKGSKHSKKTIKKMKEDTIIRMSKLSFIHPRLGKKHSKMIRRKISRFTKKAMTPEIIKKLSKAHKGLKTWNTGLTRKTDIRVKKNIEKLIKISKEMIKLGIKKSNSKALKRKYALGELISPMLGKKHSNEAIKKIKEARKNQILPLKDTTIEVKIQNFLKQLKITFFTHQYMKGIEHGYQCDILIPSMNLIIECDGDYWHKYPVGNNIDYIRTSELIEKGFKVLRLWEREIKVMDLNNFKEKINAI